MKRSTTAAGAIAFVALMAVPACRGPLRVPQSTYRETVSAFYAGLAALQTSQELLAREKLERVTTLVPEEPAGWANVGLLLLRQQEVEPAIEKLTKAAGLAPKSAEIQRLLALARSRQGKLPEALGHWKKALELDPNDGKAAFALAQDTERQGGPESEAAAQDVLGRLLARSDNLAVRLDYARLSAKRGDASALQKAIAPLGEASRSWPPEAREQLEALRAAAAANPRAAAPRVAFLKNVLLREPAYRRALRLVSTPRDEVGEPLVRFLALENPPPQPAAPDTDLSFAVERLTELTNRSWQWVGPVWLTGEGPPVIAASDGRTVAVGATILERGASRGATSAATPGLDGVVAADLDYDFHTDLVLAGVGGLRLLRQSENGRFEDFSRSAGLSTSALGGSSFGAWAADVDTDGDLDVVVAPLEGPPLVLRNNGDRTFAEQRPFDGVGPIRGFAWADFDGEGVPDAALLQSDGRVRVFLNQRGGTFSEAPLPEGLPKGAALATAEVTGDSLLDVVVLTSAGAVGRLAFREDGTRWEWLEMAGTTLSSSRLEPGGARLLVCDLDNNGAADVVATGAADSRVLLAGPRLTFAPLGAAPPLRALAAADLDGDGRLELVGVDGEGRAAVARSSGKTKYRWQALRPRAATATGDQRINSFGIGGEAELRTGLHVQKQAIAAPYVHFGLGEAASADVLRIVWPNGVLQSEFDKPADTTVAASQRLKGSCPWLFAWNGREMAFVTDVVWRSPLGLRINAQATADVLMTEDWVKIAGSQLAPRDGAYDLRITAELWETHFFDLLSLLVVDHPAGTEVFVDERFAVPPPKLRVVATGPVERLVARDDAGRDVSGDVAGRDGRHLDFAGRGAYQGVTRDHFVELELPEEAPRRGPLWLVAQGWVHPTDSSVNVALSQGTHARPRGLSLLVAEASGRFREALSGLGFPAGKDKTVLLDLTGLFPATGPRRLRLSTNLEIFWDRLGWAIGRPDVRLAPLRLPLTSAELRYRGYNVTEQASASAPERPRYLLAGTAPRWLDLRGYHTRFGEVGELLRQVDDRYVIMNAGDEMALRFPEAPGPASGLVRDFVFVGDGWVKDGDFNTTFSRTVLPLPTHASGRYATPPGRLEDDPVYRKHPRDFEEYHTRYVSPEGPRDALRATIEASR
jgi:cytochrome c-type biogenesis protein CcmH/NrfG